MNEAVDSARERLVLPLDVADRSGAERLLDELAPEVGIFKVGLELFVAEGPPSVAIVHERNLACFLDLKLHDIPATVAGAVRSAVRLGVRYLTVHTSAGPQALSAAVEAAAGSSTQLLGVTVLTSLDQAQLDAIGVSEQPDAAVLRRAHLAVDCGLTGLVCSPRECSMLRRELGGEIVLVVPGIRPAGSDVGDQARVSTPAEAIRDGADLLVVGRPIRNAADRPAAARAVRDEIAGALATRP